ncbi:hypothetical protein GCM10020256_48650 [Streptomyces thermocoprophilus]
MGVKSVLVVTDTPEFFSSTGSFGFNRAWSYEQIKAVPGVTARYGPEFDAPVLRMARPLDMQAERAADPVLDELLGWAVTVVRLPLLQGADERLGRDMHGTRGKEHGEPREEFPVGFQLFSPHVGKVVLEDRRPSPSVRRVLTAQRSGDLHTVVEERNDKAASTEKWRVFTVTHEPGPAARADAGELHDRIALDLSWGVPALVKDPDSGLHVSRGARGRGKFWSFFPTKYEMSLSGVLNGAWKTNEDRQNLLDSSPFNQEMIRRSAQLVVDSLPALAPRRGPRRLPASAPRPCEGGHQLGRRVPHPRDLGARREEPLPAGPGRRTARADHAAHPSPARQGPPEGRPLAPDVARVSRAAHRLAASERRSGRSARRKGRAHPRRGRTRTGPGP